jgi:hypothetical protein
MKNRVARVLIVGALVLLIAGCEAASEQKVRDLYKKWQENDLQTIMAAVFGTSTGNAGQDALIQGVTESEKQDDVTKQARDAVERGDSAALDALIAANPGDYGLKLMRGTLALAAGDTREFVSEYASVENQRSTDTIIKNKIVELRIIAPQLEGHFRSANQCDEYYGTLAQLHRQRFEINHHQVDLDKAAEYDNTHATVCPTLPR